MRFKNCTINQRLNHAISYVETLLHEDSRMMFDLRQKNDWKYNSGSSEEIVKELIIKRPIINVYTYRPFNPFTRAIGYYKNNAIHINIKFLDNFDYQLVCGLLLHEYAHYCGYSHGNNFKTQDKVLYSVPYYLSENVTRW
jgi:hypothetical protein